MHSLYSVPLLLLPAMVASQASAQNSADLPAAAATVQPGVVSTYNPSFFESIQPNTAYDMVARLPGFTFNAGLSLRGYSGTAGNVLVDGRRPATKNENLQVYLERIPASSVAEVQLIRGAVPAIDMQGYPVVANVILKKSARTLVASVYAKPYSDGFLGFGTQIDGSQTFGVDKISGSLLIFREEGSDAGRGEETARIVDIPAPFDEKIRVKNPEYGTTIAGGYAQTGPNDELKLQGNFSFVEFKEDEYPIPAQNAGPIGGDFLSEKDITNKGEGSAEYTKHVSPAWTFTGLVLQTLQYETTTSGMQQLGVGTDFQRRGLSGETITRAKAEFAPATGLEFDAGSEADYNFLNASSSLFVNGQGASVPGGVAFVQEWRTEPFLTAKFSQWKDIAGEIGLRTEASTISVTDSAKRSESFQFAKPRLLVSWSFLPTDQLRFRIEREVGQLNFEDFAAASDLETGVVTAGNASLRPEHDWAYEIALEHHFWSSAAVVLTLTHYEIENVIDQIAINGLSAAGNIGSGTRNTAHLSLTVPLAKLGIERGLMTLDETWLDSEVRDPLTGVRRAISGDKPHEGTLTVSDDFPSLNSTLTVTASQAYSYTNYLATEIDSYRVGTTFGVSWEYKPVPNRSILLQVNNILGVHRSLSRDLFSGIRGEAPQIANLTQMVDRGLYFYLRLRQAL